MMRKGMKYVILVLLGLFFYYNLNAFNAFYNYGFTDGNDLFIFASCAPLCGSDADVARGFEIIYLFCHDPYTADYPVGIRGLRCGP